MQPLLLRSAGVVGLTGAILGVISSGALFAGSGSEPPEEPSRVIANRDVQSVATDARPAAPAESTLSAGMTFTPAAGVFTRDESGQEPVVNVASVAPGASVAAPTADAPPVPAAPAISPGAASEPASPEDSSADATANAKGDIPPNAANGPLPEPPEQADAVSASPWAEDAVECPRDWVAGPNDSGAPPAGCPEAGAASLELAAAPTDQSALDEAAVERASEEAGLQFVARLPLPRPDYKPPPPPRKTATKAGAKRPADPPPNCGSKKRARWRYVDRVPTWYCR